MILTIDFEVEKYDDIGTLFTVRTDTSDTEHQDEISNWVSGYMCCLQNFGFNTMQKVHPDKIVWLAYNDEQAHRIVDVHI